MKWKSQSLFYNAAEKSIIMIKFDGDNNTVVILYKKQQKSWHQSNISLVQLSYLSFDWFEASCMLLFS